MSSQSSTESNAFFCLWVLLGKGGVRQYLQGGIIKVLMTTTSA